MRRRQQQQLKNKQEAERSIFRFKIGIEAVPLGENKLDDSKPLSAYIPSYPEGYVKAVNDPSARVPAEIMEQAKNIRAGIKSGKKLCQDCLKLFDTKQGLIMHQRRWCKRK